MTKTTQREQGSRPTASEEELPPSTATRWDAENGRIWNEEDVRQCISTLKAEMQERALQYLSDQGQWIEETGRLKAENEMMRITVEDTNKAFSLQTNLRNEYQFAYELAQSQAAAMAGLLEELNNWNYDDNVPDELVARINATLAAWREGK